jgi:4-hydroxy-tetrahydrodipicolinate synthase
MFFGIYTALVTPFKDKTIDEKAFQDFVAWQIKEGVHGVVPCGTTGESPTLTYEEHSRVIELCIEVAKGKVKVMAGTGANNTVEAIMFTKHAQKLGADGALIVTPYYNKPTQEGLFQHYKAIHDATEIPIVVYNIPGRSVVDIKDETFERLAKLPRIIGIKDATGDLARVSSLRARVGDRFNLLSGEDITAVAFNAQGGQGCISVSSNIVPRACAAVQNAMREGDFKTALALHEPLVPLHQVMFCETNPAPVKYAVSKMHKLAPNVRLPLVMPGGESCDRIETVMRSLKLI